MAMRARPNRRKGRWTLLGAEEDREDKVISFLKEDLIFKLRIML